MSGAARPPADLRALLSPRGIAVLGASADFNKLNGRTVKALLDRGYGGLICPVNPKYESLAGLRCYPDVASLPDGVELGIIVTPTEAAIPGLHALGERGIRAAVVFSAGFGENGAAGEAREAELKSVARAAGIRLLGPNCLGLINAFEKVIATFSYFAQAEVPAGRLAFVSQSGAFGTATASLARQRGLHLGYFANTGNEADLGFADLMAAMLTDPRIVAGAGYIEGLRDGEGFVEAAGVALDQGKPLVVTKVGRTSAGARAVASHTGALAGEDRVFDAIARQYGVTRARNEEQLLDFVEILSLAPAPRGRRLAIVTRSGGAGALIADRADELGLVLASFTDDTKVRLAEIVPSFGSTANPVDVTAQGLVNPNLLRDSLLAVLADPEVDMGVLWISFSHSDLDRLVANFTEVRRLTDKPFAIGWVGAPPGAQERLREVGVPVLRGGEAAVDALHALVTQTENRAARQRDRGAGGALPAPPALPAADGIVPTEVATRLLLEAGIPMAPAILARTAAEAAELAGQLGFPVAVKVESPDIGHKTEADGVRLRLADAAAVADAFTAVTRAARQHAPGARLAGAIVQPMAKPGLELVLGIRREPAFGPVVMVGFGGVLVEVLQDVAFRRAPIGEEEALRMLGELRAQALLDGVRGRPRIDRTAIARMIAALSRFAASAGDRLAEIDLNPVIVGPDGPVVVDCLMLLEKPHS